MASFAQGFDHKMTMFVDKKTEFIEPLLCLQALLKK